MKELSYFEIAKYALEHKEYDLFRLAAKNRRRVLQKEIASASTLAEVKYPSEIL